MYICYIDEAGDTGRFISQNKDAQPAFILLGLILPQSSLRRYTEAFIALKQQFFPSKCSGSKHEAILAELKGSDLRAIFTKKNERNKRHAVSFFSSILKLISEHNGKIIGRAYTKSLDPAEEVSPSGIYTYSMQQICKNFQAFLDKKSALGSVICDSRDYNQNHVASHSIFTQMYKQAGDTYPCIIDMPTFGDSRNHAGIQTVDLLCSGIIYPMVMHAYCRDHGLRNIHVQPKYLQIRKEFHILISQLQFRYDEQTSNKATFRSGGIVVSDKMGKKHSGHLFKNPMVEEKELQEKLAQLVNRFK